MNQKKQKKTKNLLLKWSSAFLFSFLLKMELWEDWDKSDVVIRSEQNDEKVFWFFWDKQTAIKRFGGDEHGAKKCFSFLNSENIKV